MEEAEEEEDRLNYLTDHLDGMKVLVRKLQVNPILPSPSHVLHLPHVPDPKEHIELFG